jgi:hypothetical protein
VFTSGTLLSLLLALSSETLLQSDHKWQNNVELLNN